MSDKKARNVVEHIDEYNLNIIESNRGVGGFNLIDASTESTLVQTLRTNRHTHPYTLDLLSHELFIRRNDENLTISFEKLKSALSYRIIEYNHHSMKGNLERKKATLIALADKLEAKRTKLKQINTSLESDLFYLLNSVNVRHNNAEQGGKNYIHFVADMKDGDIEQWYDDIYQMCLLAFLELDHLERKERVKKLKEDIQKNG